MLVVVAAVVLEAVAGFRALSRMLATAGCVATVAGAVPELSR